MEEKNIKDIIIEDEGTSKGSQLKNILILLALLFIILVVSIVITRLILGGDDTNDEAYLKADGISQGIRESNLTASDTAGVSSTTESVSSGAGDVVAVGAAALAAGAATVALTSKNTDDAKNSATERAQASASAIKTPLLAERNTTSRTKVPLRTEQPDKSTKSASSQSSTPPKKRATTSASSYTQPKYVKKRPTRTTRRATVSTPKKHSQPKKATSKATSKNVTRGYYIKVGAFSNPSTSIRNIKAVKLNYRTTKTKDGKLTRVLIGPFYSRRDAQNHLAKVKSNVAADAYIAKIK